MKKLLVLCSLLSIFLSVSLLFSCDKGMFCCEEQHSAASQCTTCSPHMDSVYDTKTIPTLLVFTPVLLGQIFFRVINIEDKSVIVTFDRPPAHLS